MDEASGNGGAARRRPTMREVAARADVSLKTVSRVVNGAANVDPALAGRVRTAIAELGFRRNELASSLRAGRTTSTSGLILEDLANPCYSTIAAAAAKVARDHDSLLITSSVEERPERERELVLELCQRRVDGLLIVPAGADHAWLQPEIEMGIPAVFLDRPPVGIETDAVLIDNLGGARKAISALLEAGHRRIGVLLDAPTIHTTRERRTGAELALRDAGLPESVLVVRDNLRDPRRAGAALEALLAGPEPPTAVFTGNNRLTIGAVETLLRRQHTVDLIGFDDFESSRLLPLPFRVVTYDTGELGRRAADLLFRRIAGERVPPATVVLPTRLERRGLAGS